MDELTKVSPQEVEKQILQLRAEQERKGMGLVLKKDAGMKALDQALFELRRNKPNDRSEQDRYWAIVITDVEKAMAVFKAYVL